MYKTTIFTEGVAGIRRYLSEREYSDSIFEKYLTACRSLEAFYHLENTKCYEAAVNKNYRIHIDNLVKTGDLSERQERLYRRFSFMIDDFYNGRPIQAIYQTGKRYKYPLNEYSLQWIDKFLEGLNLAEASIPNAVTVARSFFYYLEQHNLTAETLITEKTIVDFLNFKHTECRHSMSNVLYILRKLLRFLEDNKFQITGIELAAYKTATSRRRVLPALDNEDIEKLFKSFDRKTAAGKRNYAIFLLASFCGMRCIDIANLKQDNISRKDKSITFIQHKTNRIHTIPVNQEILDAIDDYIIHARPQSDLSYVFLTVLKPYRNLQSQSIQSVFIQHIKFSGIEKNAYDGKSFHAFRRTVGKWLLESSVDAQMISQILGHHSKEVLKRYLPLAPDILRECSLDFTYAPMKTEVYK